MKTKRESLFVLITVAALAVLLAMPAVSPAAKGKFKKFDDIVDAEFVKKVIDQDQPGLVIDARPKRGKFDKGHICGSINIPQTYWDDFTHLLPADKDALMVFYCQGPKCSLSHKEAFAAAEMGYTNVKVYEAGYPDWKKKYGPGCDDPDAQAGPAKMLILEGSDQVDKVMAFIESEGIEVAGGSTAKAGPKGEGMFEAVDGIVDWDIFEDKYKTDRDSFTIVDVRDPKEFETGHFKDAVNIPVGNLAEKLPDEWNPDKPVVFVCPTGARSGEAYYMVKDLDPEEEVYFVEGELSWSKDDYTFKPPK
jgi:rhodanese-related sulfurtransferase